MKNNNDFTFTLEDLHPDLSGAGQTDKSKRSASAQNDFIFGEFRPAGQNLPAETEAARLIVQGIVDEEDSPAGVSRTAAGKTSSAGRRSAANNVDPQPPVSFTPAKWQESEGSYEEPKKKKRKKSGVLKVIGRIAIVLLETLLLLVGALYGVMFVLAKGPSDTARSLFVRSVRETSAIGFLADLYFSEEEIAEIVAKSNVPSINTDVSLVNISSQDTLNANGADAWGYVDEDGDGIIVVDVKGEGYIGFMMIILDPSRVICATVPQQYGNRGFTVEEMVKRFDGVAGINAGGFEDTNGNGDGSIPEHLVMFEGRVANPGGIGTGFVGLDRNNILHVGFNSSEEVLNADIQYGCCYGPYLVINGEGVVPDTLASGLNPRTAIGQRSDGAILFLVIDGRQVISLGATYEDEMNIMLEFGAVNACNLDGGSSTMMYYKDGYVNNCASVIGIRPVPTAFVVLKEGVKANG